MRPLTEKEAQIFFEKLVKFIGDNVQKLLERDSEKWTFREHHQRVYCMRESMAHLCPVFAYKQLLSAGICIGQVDLWVFLMSSPAPRTSRWLVTWTSQGG